MLLLFQCNGNICQFSFIIICPPALYEQSSSNQRVASFHDSSVTALFECAEKRFCQKIDHIQIKSTSKTRFSSGICSCELETCTQISSILNEVSNVSQKWLFARFYSKRTQQVRVSLKVWLKFRTKYKHRSVVLTGQRDQCPLSDRDQHVGTSEIQKKKTIQQLFGISPSY